MAGQPERGQVLHAAVGGKATLEPAVADLLWVPPAFVCPVSREVMVDPVMAEDGWSYDRHAIEAWLLRRPVSPLTNLPMGIRLRENLTLRQAIEQYVEAAGSSEAQAHFQRLREDAKNEGFRFDEEQGVIVKGLLHFLPCRPAIPGRGVPFDVHEGRLRFLDAGGLWTQESFDLAERTLECTVILDCRSRPRVPEFIMAFSSNMNIWEARTRDRGCDALSVCVSRREEHPEKPTLWIRSRMFEDQIAYGPIGDWPPVGRPGQVKIRLNNTTLELDVFGQRTRVFDVAEKVPSLVHIGFIGYGHSNSAEVLDLQVY